MPHQHLDSEYTERAGQRAESSRERAVAVTPQDHGGALTVEQSGPRVAEAQSPAGATAQGQASGVPHFLRLRPQGASTPGPWGGIGDNPAHTVCVAHECHVNAGHACGCIGSSPVPCCVS